MPIPFVSENIIDQIAINLSESEEQYTLAISELKDQQPVILSYILSENFDLLTKKEKDYLLYLTLVIWKAVQQVATTTELIDTEQIDEMEEANWGVLHASTARRFKERLDTFFDNTSQEDLLAFIEDSLVEEEEEEFLTKEGKELLFIGLKTIIDCLVIDV